MPCRNQGGELIVNVPPPSWTPGVRWWLPRPKRPLGWTEGLGQNPFPMGWDGEHDVRGTGEDERPQGVGLLHRVGRTRSGSSPGDQRRPRPLTSSAVTPAVKVRCTSWTHGPWGVGVLGWALKKYGLEAAQPGLIFLLRALCSRWARLWWSPVASRTVSMVRKLGSLCWIQTLSSLSSSNQSVRLWGCVLYDLGFKSEIEKKIRVFHRKNILDHDLKFYDFKLPTSQVYSSRLQWWVSLRRNKHIWNV